MDNKDDIIRTAAIVFIAVTVGPIVIGGAIAAVNAVGCGVINGVNHVKYKHRIKKGLKDGSIVEIDGKYYEVEVKNIETEEA